MFCSTTSLQTKVLLSTLAKEIWKSLIREDTNEKTLSSMEDSKIIMNATLSALLNLTATGSVLAHMEDFWTQQSSSSIRTHITVTGLVF